MLTVDAHVHLGTCRVFDETTTEEDILRTMDENNVDVSIVQPMFVTIDIEEYRKMHNRIYKMTKDYPGRIFGMASMNPHIKVSDYQDELKRCVEELGFRAVKLQPGAHSCAPDSKDGYMVAETATRLNIPVMVHGGAGIPAALPSNVIPVAKAFPETTFIIAHSGMIIGSGEALLAAKLCDNVILETSWCVPHHILGYIEAIGAERVMFASDEYLNVPAEIAKINYLKITSEQRKYIMGEVSNRVFNLNLENN